MFPSSNINNPFDYSLSKRPFFPSDQNPSQVQDHDPPFLFTNFPSPFFDEHESPLNQILFQNQAHGQIITDHNNTEDNPTKKNSKKSNLESSASMRRRNQLGVVPRRRAGKKDRHSKICTAQGIRDRRMRLSLQIARKFFDLQDMLGYDKASKTIEWLFTQSKKAINELNNNINNSNASDAKSESFVSECEVVSGNDDQMSTIPPAEEDEKTIFPFNPDGEKLKKSREAARDKARARARSRTREKVMMKTLEISGEGCYKPNPICNDDNLDQKLGFLEEIRVSPNYEQQLADVGTIEKLLGDSICPTASSSTVSGPNLDPSNNFMGFMGNWDSLLAGNPNYTIYSATPKFQGFHQ